VKRTAKSKRGTPYTIKAPIRVLAEENNQAISAAAAALPPSLQNCGSNVTPACLKAMYGIPNATLSTPGNSLGLYQQGSYFAEPDIDLFFQNYAPYVPQGTYPINASIDGASYSVDPASDLNSGEADLDILISCVIFSDTLML